MEIIISFAIFFIFIILLFLVIRPSKFQSEKVSLVKHLESELSPYLSTSLIVTSIVNKTGTSGTCFSIPNLPETKGLKVVVKDKDKKSVNAFVSSDSKLFVSQPAGFFNIYYNERLDEANFTISPPGCQNLTLADYQLGLINNLTFVSLNKTSQLAHDLGEPAVYNSIKTKFGVPANSDFGFFLRDAANEKIVYTENKEKLGSSVEVYAEEFPISYIDDKANLNQGWINIQVW